MKSVIKYQEKVYVISEHKKKKKNQKPWFKPERHFYIFEYIYLSRIPISTMYK